MLLKHTLTFILFIGLTGFAYASCDYNGKSYPEGSKIGPYTCSNGEWV